MVFASFVSTDDFDLAAAVVHTAVDDLVGHGAGMGTGACCHRHADENHSDGCYAALSPGIGYDPFHA
jgi:hypothetical protein